MDSFFDINEVIFVSPKGLGTKEFPKWNPQSVQHFCR